LSDPSEQSLGPTGSVDQRIYRRVRLTPEAKRENMRGFLAGSLVLLLATVVMASFLQQWIHPDRDKGLHEWMNLVFSPLVALVGAATGFYFGAQSAKKEGD
jgi:hypothetical protein